MSSDLIQQIKTAQRDAGEAAVIAHLDSIGLGAVSTPPGQAPIVTPEALEANIVSEFYFTASDGVLGESELGTKPAAWTNLDLITICVLITKNGTKLVGVNEGPVSRQNFNAETGRTRAREKAIAQLWPLLGFELRTKLSADAA